MKKLLLLNLTVVMAFSANAQKFQPGFFIDRHDQKLDGLIRTNPSGKSPIKDEGFIVFKDNEKGTETRFAASDIKCFVIGRDSFVVAHAPHNETWSAQELDFVKVVLNEDVKLYCINGWQTGGGGGGSGLSFHPGVSIGTGIGGGYGGYGGVGTGVGVGLGGGGNGGGKQGKISYYYGPNTAQMNQLTVENFNDVMSDIMGDEPEALDAIRSGKYTVGNVEQLIVIFRRLKAQHAAAK